MKSLAFAFMLTFSLAGCGAMDLMNASNLGNATHGVISVLNYFDSTSETRQKIKNAEIENMCVYQLVGSVEEWPAICPSTLSKMDACGRIDFVSALCNKERAIFEVKYSPETKQRGQLQEVQTTTDNTPVKKVTRSKKKSTKLASKKKSKKSAGKVMPAKLKL
ncbi:hypothetical protein K9M47_00490 [Candidatus Gracilibacteria bacterium]|nr:hypothetical protein [Candidatus Gracilibacteria bacterium]